MPEIEVEYLANQARIFGPVQVHSNGCAKSRLYSRPEARPARPAFALRRARSGGAAGSAAVWSPGAAPAASQTLCVDPREPDQDQARERRAKRGKAGALDT